MPTITVISSPTRKTYWWAEIQKLSRPPASDHYRVLVTRDGQRLMVVMPHPDDECFGCASTIARYGTEGAAVSLVTMTRGGARLWNGRVPGELRQLTEAGGLEHSDAASELGRGFVEVYAYPDGPPDRLEE